MPIETHVTPLLLRAVFAVAVASGAGRATADDAVNGPVGDPTQRWEAYVKALAGDDAGGGATRSERRFETGQSRFYRVFEVDDGLRFGLSAEGPRRLATDDRRKALAEQAATATTASSSSRPPSLTIAPTLSYSAAPGLTLVGGAQIRHINGRSGGGAATLDFSEKTPGEAGLMETGTPRGDGVNLQGYGVGGSLGVLYAPSPATRLAVLFRSAIRFGEDGGRFGGAGAGNSGGGGGGRVAPEALSFSARQALNPRWTATANLQWTNWSRSQGQGAGTGGSSPPGFAPPGAAGSGSVAWRDAWSMTASTSYRIDDQWTLRAGLAYDQSPARQSGQGVDGDRTWLSFTAAYRADERLTVNGGYTHVFGGGEGATSRGPSGGGPSGGGTSGGGLSGGGLSGGGMSGGRGDIVAAQARLTF